MKTSRWCLVPLPALLMALVVAGCSAPARTTATAAPVTETAAPWVRTELFFSLGEWTETALSTEAETRWVAFLDQQVTPRFPDGLSVIDVYGQGRGRAAGSPLLHERSRLLVLIHRDTPSAAARIEEIREAWKRPTGEASVMKVTQRVDVDF